MVTEIALLLCDHRIHSADTILQHDKVVLSLFMSIHNELGD